MPKAEPFVEKLIRGIVENDKVDNSFALQAECRGDKAMDDWRVSKYLVKSVTELTDHAIDVAIASRHESCGADKPY